MKSILLASLIISSLSQIARAQNATAQDSTSIEGDIQKEMLIGSWDVSLFYDVSAPPSSTTMEISSVKDGNLVGTFYNTPFEMGRYVIKGDEVIISLITSDGTGAYYTSGRLSSKGSFEGQTLSTGRDFLMPWTAKAHKSSHSR